MELFLDAESGRVSKVQTLQNDPIWGDVLTEVTYGDWSTPEDQHLTGGTHHSLAIKLSEGIVVVEPPLNEARSKAVLSKRSEDPRHPSTAIAAERAALESAGASIYGRRRH